MPYVKWSSITIRTAVCTFISYATFWIKRRMRICGDNSPAVHLSFNVGDEVRRYRKIMRKYRRSTAVILLTGSCAASYMLAKLNSTRSFHRASGAQT